MRKYFSVQCFRHAAMNYSHHLVVCLTTGPKPLPKRALHIVRSRASSFKWEYPLLSLRSSNSFLRLLPCLPVTSTPPCIFPSTTCCRRQFLRKMWPIQFALRLRISCRIFLCSLTLSTTSSFLTWMMTYLGKFKFAVSFPILWSAEWFENDGVSRTSKDAVLDRSKVLPGHSGGGTDESQESRPWVEVWSQYLASTMPNIYLLLRLRLRIRCSLS